ncbi:TIGR02391 family protein [Gordonia paraffinivorans]|uniref:TIGR02391 family protein n=1 Tax=Gordonia paraffinivorans TaxID=175628 RepID=UPI001E61F1BB|nr:TIGR02391 family protein [Gordonia paraffinivorans]MCD2146512.1 TIGR02391 family protein [Gordonia paraffinivorans]
MNTEWVIAELDKFIDQTVMRRPDPVPGVVDLTGRMVTAANHEDITKQAHVVEQILDRVLAGWRDLEVSNKSNRWNKHRAAALRAKEALLREAEIRDNLGENAPELSAAELHPWIWEGAKSLWQSGHYREAVGGAIRKLNAEAQNKVDRRDVSETDLFKQAFSMDEPKVGKSRLRRMKDDGSDTYKSVQRGAMALAEGVFAGIRNPLSHEVDQELSEQEALEYLAALSVLARWVDQSDVETAS